MAIVGGLVLVAKGVAGVVDQANPCGLAAGLGLSNAGLGPAYILVADGFLLVCGRLVCAGRVQGMGMGMGVVAFAGHGGFRRAWWQAAVAGEMPYSTVACANALVRSTPTTSGPSGGPFANRRLSRVNGSARERRRFRSNLLEPFLPVAQLVEFHLQSHWVAVAVEPRAFVSVPLPRPS